MLSFFQFQTKIPSPEIYLQTWFMGKANRLGPLIRMRAQTVCSPPGNAAKQATTLNRQNSSPPPLHYTPRPKSLFITHTPVWSGQGRDFWQDSQNNLHELQHSSLRSSQPQWIISVSPFNGILGVGGQI